MANLLDYVRWRGDLAFADHPFNIVDNLVLAALANLDLTDVVPTRCAGGSISAEDAADRLAQRASGADADRRLLFVPADLLVEMGHSNRYRNAQLSDYVDVTSADSGVQFAALTITIDDGTGYVSFRGTDTTLIGWREDFTMSFEVMPSQTMATDYLRQRIHESTRPLRVGGHSKGGNLAVFSAMKQSSTDQARILTVYSNDGPGLSPEVADAEQLAGLGDKIVKVVPEFSVIGRIFDHNHATHIVASTGTSVMQHDIMTWQVEGAGLVEREAESAGADVVNRAIDGWLAYTSDHDRRDFVDALFGSLSAGGAVLIQDVPDSGRGSLESVIVNLVRSRTQSRRSIRIGIQAAWRAVRSLDYSRLLRRRATIRALALVIAGIVLVTAPALALQVLAAFAIFAISIYVAARLGRYFLQYRRRHRLRWGSVVVAGVILAVIFFGITHINALVVPVNLLLSGLLIVNAWSSGRRALDAFYKDRPRRGKGTFLAISAVASLLFGVVALSTASRVMPFYVMQLGQYLLIVGLVELFLVVQDRARPRYSREVAERTIAESARSQS